MMRITVIAILMAVGLPTQLRAGTVYDAVADFSIAANPNGTWSYLNDLGSGPQLLTQTIVGSNGIDYRWSGQGIPDSIETFKNTTSAPVDDGTRVVPPNLLGMDPEIATADITRWTAPSTGMWSFSGLFQGIDIDQHAHTVEILENSSIVLLASTTISSYGQTVDFSGTVSLTQGDTIDFIVNGTPSYTFLSTGLSATIQLASVPEPSSIMMAVIGGLILSGCSCYRRLRYA
jgi:hypothetical protein